MGKERGRRCFCVAQYTPPHSPGLDMGDRGETMARGTRRTREGKRRRGGQREAVGTGRGVPPPFPDVHSPPRWMVLRTRGQHGSWSHTPPCRCGSYWVVVVVGGGRRPRDHKILPPSTPTRLSKTTGTKKRKAMSSGDVRKGRESGRRWQGVGVKEGGRAWGCLWSPV